MALSEQGRRAQAECLRLKGWEETARDVEAGNCEFYPDALEMLDPEPGSPLDLGGRP
jgi:hypothetical protein